VRVQTLVADGPLARVYLIAQAARYPLDLETDIQQPLLSVLDGWHDRYTALTDGRRRRPDPQRAAQDGLPTCRSTTWPRPRRTSPSATCTRC
jgi:hypothetical protein